MLEDHMGSVDLQLSELSGNAQRSGDPYAIRDVNCELGGPPTSESLPDLAHIEDSVDAMGAVVFADEEDYGFFGNTTLSNVTSLPCILPSGFKKLFYIPQTDRKCQALHQISLSCDIYP